jgi:23S rRNA (uracil1939-C5)-methyltransferase
VGSVDTDDSASFSSSIRLSFLPIAQCPIAAPILWRAAEAFLTLINSETEPWRRNPHFKLDQLELYTSADESALQFTLSLRTASKALPNKLATAFTALCEKLRIRIPELSGAGISLLPPLSAQRSRRTEQPRPGPSWGSPGLNYTIPTTKGIVTLNLSEAKGKNSRILPSPASRSTTSNQQPIATYWVPRGAFFQVNRFLLPELLALATSNRSGTLAWDLYAGVGLFSRALAACFAQVTAVEIAEPAATALAATRLPNLRAVKATTLDFLRSAVVDRDRPDLIVLDPPRTGAGAEVCTLLARIAAASIVFVSCSPETLPADLAILTASGYRIAELHLFDLFPQTAHIETVAILKR